MPLATPPFWLELKLRSCLASLDRSFSTFRAPYYYNINLEGESGVKSGRQKLNSTSREIIKKAQAPPSHRLSLTAVPHPLFLPSLPSLPRSERTSNIHPLKGTMAEKGGLHETPGCKSAASSLTSPARPTRPTGTTTDERLRSGTGAACQ